MAALAALPGARWAKPLVWLLLAVPALWLWGAAFAGQLGANPAEALIRGLGDWTLRLLCLVLAFTPLREATGYAGLARFRRAVGVAVFLYATQHLAAYAWLDQSLDLLLVLADIAKRPFILVGMLCWLLLVPLAATSFNAAIRRLGAARWKRLHRLVYAVAPLAILHFYWMRAAKVRFTEVAVYGGILALLLGWRLWRAWRRRRSHTALHASV